jgi:hypothetical protein
MLQKTLLFFVTVISFFSCRKDPSLNPNPPVNNPVWVWQLPPITQMGHNTFGCLIDGKVWIPLSGNSPPLNFSRTRKRLLIQANDDFGTGFYFLCPPATKDTSFTVSNNTVHNPDQTFIYYSDISGVGAPSLPVHGFQGTFTFTRYDTVNAIYSGTFSMTVIDTVSGHTTQITQGRFDL